jgi:hypothetical protein
MKNRSEFLSMLMLFLLLLFFSPGVYAQLDKDPQRDLSVTFSSRHEGQDPGSVFGVVRNNSTNAYPCVRIEFDLYTRSDLRPPGQQEGRHLGVLPVEVQNLQSHGVRNYEQKLTFPAGIGLKSVSECPEQPAKELPDAPEIISFTVAPQRIHAGEAATLQWRTANTDHVFVGEGNPGWPHATLEPIRAPRGVEPSGSLQVRPSQTVKYRLEAKKEGKSTFQDVTVEVTSPPTQAATCSITGRLSGKLRWNTRDDTGQPVSYTLTHIYMTTSEAAQPVRAPVQGREYTFSNVSAGKTYRIFPNNFRSQPRERSVSCQPNTTHRGVNFEITGPPPSG